MRPEDQKTLIAALLTYRTTVEGSACYRPVAEVRVELGRVDALLASFGSVFDGSDRKSLTRPGGTLFEMFAKTLLFSAQHDKGDEVGRQAAYFAELCKSCGYERDEARAVLIDLELASDVSLPPFSQLLTCYETQP